MSMNPLPPSGGRPPLSPPSTRSQGLMSPQDRAASDAEKEANGRVTHAEQTVEEAQRLADRQLDNIKDTYEKREGDQEARLDEMLDKQRLKGYEALRDQQRAQATEMSRTRRDGERELSTLTNYYRDSIYGTERKGTNQMQELLRDQGRALEYEQKSRTEDVTLTQDNHRREYETLQAENEARLQKLQANTGQDYERMRVTSAEATEKAEKNFTDRYANTIATQDETLLDVNHRANQAIAEVRRDTSQKLAAYTDRQRDPFYKLIDLDAKLHDMGDSYLLTATIPIHEQEHVSVAVKGSQLVMTGYRRNEERLETEPGHSQGTSAFQSFLETFPIAWPVDANKMSRNFDGETLSVRIPKKNDYAYHQKERPEVPRARVERPNFPGNLPIAKTDRHETGSDSDEPAPRGKRKGSGTLS